MNRAQRVVLAIGLLLIVLTGLFPNKTLEDLSRQGRETPHGRVPLWQMTRFPGVEFQPLIVDIPQLAIEWIVISAATGAGVLIAGLVKRREDRPPRRSVFLPRREE
jgi:hypothetical protein